MTAQSPRKAKAKPEQNSLSPIAATVAVLLLLVFVGWLGWRFVGPGSVAANGAYKGLAPHWVVQKAQESQGDIDKLTPDDRKQLVSRWDEATARVMWQGEYQRVLQHQAAVNQPRPPTH